MIDRDLKRSLGQMINGVQVVGAAADGVARAYCSHWVMQIAFEEPIVVISVSPKHDTHALIVESGRFAVSLLAADQVAQGQYFSYPGRRFRYLADEYVEEWLGLPVVPDAISYLACEWFERKPMADHELFFANVVAVREGRLKEPPLLYSSRLGWRSTGGPAREPGSSIRDTLLARLADVDADVDEPA